jgi:hypothetical protein
MWRDKWVTIKQVAKSSKDITTDLLLEGNPKCLGYISNKCRPYNQKQTEAQRKWAEKIFETAGLNLTPHTNKNTKDSIKIMDLTDYGTITNTSQKVNKAIFEMTTKDTQQINLGGSKELLIKAGEQFEELAEAIIERIVNNY